MQKVLPFLSLYVIRCNSCFSQAIESVSFQNWRNSVNIFFHLNFVSMLFNCHRICNENLEKLKIPFKRPWNGSYHYFQKISEGYLFFYCTCFCPCENLARFYKKCLYLKICILHLASINSAQSQFLAKYISCTF